MSGKRAVHVEILGDAKSLSQAFGSAEHSAGGFGSKMAGLGKVAAIGFAAVGAAAVAVGAGLFKVGEQFDEAFDTIRTGTGATGDALKGLEEDFKGVVSSVPTDFKSASTAVADLNTRLGLTGQPLQKMSEQFINLARITGEDLSTSIANGTRVFGDWSVASEDQSAALDHLFKVSQSTGIGVNDLMAKVVQFGAPLRQMGFGLEESAALLGKWEKEGVNSELVLGSLRIAMGKFAKDNIPMRQGLDQTIASIQKMGPGAAATSLAMEIFGARAGPDMAAAILEGRFAVEDLEAVLAASNETINKAAEDTFDFAESWQLFKNRALVAIQPVAAKVFEFAAIVMNKLGPALLSVLPMAIGWFTKLAGMLQGPVTAAFTLIRDGVLTFIQALSGDWSDNENIHGLHRVIGNIGLVIREQVIPAVMGLASWFQDTLWPIIQQGVGFVQSIIAALTGEGGSGGGLKSALGRIGEIIGELAPIVLDKLGGLAIEIGGWIVNVGIPWLAGKLGGWADAFGAWAVDAVPPMLTRLSELLSALGNWIADEGLPLLFDKLGEWGQALVDWVGPRIVPVLTALGELLLAVGEWIATVAAPAIGEKLLEWGLQFVAWVQPQIGPLLSELGVLLSDLGSWLIDTALPEIAAKLGEWGGAFLAWVGPQIPPLLGELGLLLIDVGDWILTTALPEIAEKLIKWGWAFVAWVATDALPYIVPKLWELANAITAWIIDDALPAIGEKLLEWGDAFLDWIGPVLLDLPGNLWDIVNMIADWIREDATPVIKAALGEWSAAFIDWTTDVDTGLPAQLEEINTSILRFILDNGPIYAVQLSVWHKEFLRWAANVAIDLPAELGKIRLIIANWMSETLINDIIPLAADWTVALIQWALDVAEGLPAALGEILLALLNWVSLKREEFSTASYDLGKSVIDGIVQAIGDLSYLVTNAVTGVVSDAIDAAKRFLRADSPSQLAADEIGRPIPEGIAAGILSGAGLVSEAFVVLTDHVQQGFDSVINVAQDAADTFGSVVNTFSDGMDTIGSAPMQPPSGGVWQPLEPPDGGGVWQPLEPPPADGVIGTAAYFQSNLGTNNLSPGGGSQSSGLVNKAGWGALEPWQPQEQSAPAGGILDTEAFLDRLETRIVRAFEIGIKALGGAF